MLLSTAEWFHWYCTMAFPDTLETRVNPGIIFIYGKKAAIEGRFSGVKRKYCDSLWHLILIPVL